MVQQSEQSWEKYQCVVFKEKKNSHQPQPFGKSWTEPAPNAAGHKIDSAVTQLWQKSYSGWLSADKTHVHQLLPWPHIQTATLTHPQEDNDII